MATVREEKTKLINSAVLRLRHSGFTTTELDFDTPGNNTERISKLVVDTFDDVVKEVLETIPWVCVSTINDTLTQDTNHNSEFFDYAYKLPADYIRLVGNPWFSGVPIHYSVDRYSSQNRIWQITGYESGGQRKFETKYQAPGIRYVFLTTYANPNSDTDTYYTLLDEMLRQTIIQRLRVEWAFGITGEPSMEREMEILYERRLQRARDYNNKQLGRMEIRSDSLNYARVRG